MKTRGMALALALVAGGLASQAQTPQIPFDKLQRESQPQLPRSSDLVAAADAAGFSSSAIPAAAVVPTRRTPAIVPPVVDHKFLLLNGLHLGMALFDVGMTERCISNHQCKEGNPMMPSSLGGQLGVSLGGFAYTAGASYYLKKHHSKSWWLPSLTGTIAHSVGVGSGLAVR